LLLLEILSIGNWKLKARVCQIIINKQVDVRKDQQLAGCRSNR